MEWRVEEKMVGESSRQCAVITLKNSEKCILVNNKWSQQWMLQTQDICTRLQNEAALRLYLKKSYLILNHCIVLEHWSKMILKW